MKREYLSLNAATGSIFADGEHVSVSFTHVSDRTAFLSACARIVDQLPAFVADDGFGVLARSQVETQAELFCAGPGADFVSLMTGPNGVIRAVLWMAAFASPESRRQFIAKAAYTLETLRWGAAAVMDRIEGLSLPETLDDWIAAEARFEEDRRLVA
jgi:hypothetical protein